MPLSLYLITEDDILPVRNPKSITSEQIIAVSDEESKAVYIWKGEYSPNFDVFKADTLYERVLQRFANPNVYIVKELEIVSGETDQIKNVKKFLKQNLPNQEVSKWKHALKEVFLLKSVRQKIEEFKRYENSSKWRAKLSNLTNLRRLSIFNVISILAVVVILILKIVMDLMGDSFIFIEGSTINAALWDLWLSALMIVMIICSIMLSVVVVINLSFVMFPMKFPINPKAMEVILFRSSDAILEQVAFDRQISGVDEEEGEGLPPAPEMPPVSEGKTVQAPPIQPKLKINLPQLKASGGSSINKSGEPANLEKIYESDDDAKLDIPKIPMRKAIKVKTTDLEDQLILEQESESSDIKTILIECEICKKTIKMPVPKKVITESKVPVTDVTYIHGEPAHAITAQLDKDFQVRRQRSAPAIFQEKPKTK